MEHPASEASAGDRDGARLAERRARVDAFVRRHFGWPGTLRLHAGALGPDVLKAPVNLALSPVLVATRLLAWLCRRLGRPASAAWLGRRRILLRTTVSGRIEALIVGDLLALPLPPPPHDRDALARAMLAAPPLQDMIARGGSEAEARAMADRALDAVAEYAGVRSAVAEITTALVTLAVGALAFRALTPGMLSMAPGVAEALSLRAAVADFPLGATLGAFWYGVFPVGARPSLVAGAFVALLLLGSVVAAFAGVLADPVQRRLGIHRRRLLRLLETVEAELGAAGPRPFVAREHYYVRTFDLWDAALSVVRALRG